MERTSLILPYDQNDLRFDYVGLHYSESSKNRYAYTLENFNREWIDAGTQRNATYTNLDPGTYIFRVKAANRDGVWSTQEASITVIITPPWWDTPLAYVLYASILLSILYGFWKLQMRRVRIRHELHMSRFEAEKMHEIDEMKTNFFTNISHEFRTPLTLILGPVKQIAETIHNDKIKTDLGIVYNNGRKLLRLVNELLDIAKLESGSMKLRTVRQNIVPLIRTLVYSFSSHAEQKSISLEFSAIENDIQVYIDKEKLEKIVTNILSNAFKFTPEGGRITVTIVKNGFAGIRISDTGIGISKEKLSRIFDRFYQIDGSHTRSQKGTGIGLSLTKELIELHKGTISVESEEGKGTTFSVTLPLGDKHLQPDEICETEENADHLSDPMLISDSIEQYNAYGSNGSIHIDLNTPVILIVEDNADVRHYIKEIVEGDFTVLEAADGKEGWDKSVEHSPDLIVSDVMMPNMDGFELCKKLKTDERTCHIPVILLTAKATVQDKLEGFETGADEYIMKPFEPEELTARIRNLVEQRKRLHEYFKKRGLLQFDHANIVSADKKFLQKVMHVITDNISNAAFSVESLAEHTTVSHSVLHRKIVSLTGEPPVELIRRIRLTRAAELLKNKTGNISEISLEVGFSNPAYFSECFKKQFGVSPSVYSHPIEQK